MSRSFKRERGFLTFAQNSGETDYLRMAYGLALSLKATQSLVPHLSVAITPGMAVPDRYRQVFDEVIDIPWLDEAKDAVWKLQNEWKAYHVTPYEQTVKLDADMLFPADIAAWWPLLDKTDFWACTDVETYRGDLVTSDVFRKTFTVNRLPNVYTAFMYFRYSDLALEVFRMAEVIYHNWEKFSFEYLEPEGRPKHVSTDVVFAMAIKLLDLADECTFPTIPVPRFVHMKSQLQGWTGDLSPDWTDHIQGGLSDRLKVGFYNQSLPFHYHVKGFLSDDMIARYEKELGI